MAMLTSQRCESDTRREDQTLAEVIHEAIHDARSLVTALGLYCDLLEAPGVLSPACQHYSDELRLVSAASRRLVEKLVKMESWQAAFSLSAQERLFPSFVQEGALSFAPPSRALIANLAEELKANRNLLAALAGPSISVVLEIEGGARAAELSGENLTRILVNLIKNSAEAMSNGGVIRVALRERSEAATGTVLELSVEDNGHGMAAEVLERIFDTGSQAGEPVPSRSLGLSVARSIVQAAGGSIHAENLYPVGTRIAIELPVRSG